MRVPSTVLELFWGRRGPSPAQFFILRRTWIAHEARIWFGQHVPGCTWIAPGAHFMCVGWAQGALESCLRCAFDLLSMHPSALELRLRHIWSVEYTPKANFNWAWGAFDLCRMLSGSTWMAPEAHCIISMPLGRTPIVAKYSLYNSDTYLYANYRISILI